MLQRWKAVVKARKALSHRQVTTDTSLHQELLQRKNRNCQG